MPDDITPARSDVGAILRARTRSDATGEEIGTFDETTRPSGAEVDSYIEQAEVDVRLRLSADVPDNLEPFAKRLVAIRAAMFVELSYDPDRTDDDASAYARLKDLFDESLALLMSVAEDDGADVSKRGLVEVSLSSPFSDDDEDGVVDPADYQP